MKRFWGVAVSVAILAWATAAHAQVSITGGIAGTVLDSETEPSLLWKVDQSALRNGATITGVELVNDALPPTSEGLVVQTGAKRAIVLVDGGLDEDNHTCKPPAGQLTITLP